MFPPTKISPLARSRRRRRRNPAKPRVIKRPYVVIHELEGQLNPPLNLELVVIVYQRVLAVTFFFPSRHGKEKRKRYVLLYALRDVIRKREPSI